MYRTILLLLYLIFLIVPFIQLVRYRESPFGRRLWVVLGIGGLLISPMLSGYLCELFSGLFSIFIFLIIFFLGIGLLFKSLFRWR